MAECSREREQSEGSCLSSRVTELLRAKPLSWPELAGKLAGSVLATGLGLSVLL